MKRPAFLITVVVAMVFGLVRIGLSQDTDTISIDEVETQKRLEAKHSNIIYGLKKKYPNADFSDVKWLKDHPDAAKRLLNNERWLNKHPDIAERIHNGNINADRREDIRDRREDFRDKREDIRDRREDIKDRQEDVADRREDIIDRRDDVIKADRLSKLEQERKELINSGASQEDIRKVTRNIHNLKGNIAADKREDIRDRREDIKDRREDRIDRREDVRDRREDVRDRREDIRDRRGSVFNSQKGIHGRKYEMTRADRFRKLDRAIKKHKREIRGENRAVRKKRRIP